ncbi:MAG: ABC transporter ATP-binding protein [Thermodesulfobacteriota bacterium]
MLELREVNTYYGKSHVLFDISFQINQGEIVALLGRNGVGKTTTLRTIMGLTPPASGSIRYKGVEMAGKKTHQIAFGGVGFVPEERWIFPNLTVHQNLIMGIKPGQYGKENREGWTIDRCYEYFPLLKARQNSKGGHLSGGEMQMLAIARTLMGNPELILVDEPTEGLAPIIVEVVGNVIREIKGSGTTVLLVEQKLQLVMGLAQRIYIMSKGIIQWEGTPEVLRGQEEIRKKYLEV